MTLQELLAELDLLGVTIEADGDRLGFTPRNAVGPDLIEALKVQKQDLLAMLTRDSREEDIDDDLVDVTDLLVPCDLCGGIDQWQSATGAWRCMACDPPTKSRRWLKLRAELLERQGRSRACDMARTGATR